MCRALPRHLATFRPAAQGVLWDRSRAVPSQWGLATFVREDVPVIAQAQGFGHKAFPPTATGTHGDHPRSRTARVVRVHDHGEGGPVTVARVHGLRDGRGEMDAPERAEQARRFARLVGSVAEPGTRLVLCGDLDVEPGSQAFAVQRPGASNGLACAEVGCGARVPRPGMRLSQNGRCVPRSPAAALLASARPLRAREARVLLPPNAGATAFEAAGASSKACRFPRGPRSGLGCPGEQAVERRGDGAVRRRRAGRSGLAAHVGPAS